MNKQFPDRFCSTCLFAFAAYKYVMSKKWYLFNYTTVSILSTPTKWEKEKKMRP